MPPAPREGQEQISKRPDTRVSGLCERARARPLIPTYSHPRTRAHAHTHLQLRALYVADNGLGPPDAERLAGPLARLPGLEILDCGCTLLSLSLSLSPSLSPSLSLSPLPLSLFLRVLSLLPFSPPKIPLSACPPFRDPTNLALACSFSPCPSESSSESSSIRSPWTRGWDRSRPHRPSRPVRVAPAAGTTISGRRGRRTSARLCGGCRASAHSCSSERPLRVTARRSESLPGIRSGETERGETPREERERGHAQRVCVCVRWRDGGREGERERKRERERGCARERERERQGERGAGARCRSVYPLKKKYLNIKYLNIKYI